MTQLCLRTIAIDPGAVAGVAEAEGQTVVRARAMLIMCPWTAGCWWDAHAPRLERTGHGTIVGRGNRLITQAIEVGRTIQRYYDLVQPTPCDRAIGEKPLLTAHRPVNSSPDVVQRGNDLIQTAIRLGIYLEACGTESIRLVYPGQWKGQVPKGIHTKRTLAKLTPAERANVENDHNAIDATGLLLWGIGR